MLNKHPKGFKVLNIEKEIWVVAKINSRSFKYNPILYYKKVGPKEKCQLLIINKRSHPYYKDGITIRLEQSITKENFHCQNKGCGSAIESNDITPL